jgi:glutamine amidotransferase
VQTTHLSDKLATAVYGVEIDASIGKENICGTQFHPEKSHQFGLKILENFVEKY